MKPPAPSDAQCFARATGSSSPLQPDDCIMGLHGTPPEATQVDAFCEQEASLRFGSTSRFHTTEMVRAFHRVAGCAYALAEEGGSKLFLVAVPGETGAAEVSKRIELRERLEFEVLLQGCEQQKFLNQKNRKRKRQPPRDDAIGKSDCAGGIPALGADHKGDL